MNDSYTHTSNVGVKTPTAQKTFSRLGLSIILLTVGTVAMQYAVGFLLHWANPAFLSAWWADWMVSILPLYGIGLPSMFLALQNLPVAPYNAVCGDSGILYKKPALTKGVWVRILFMGFGCMYIGSIVGTAIMDVISNLTGYSYDNSLNVMVEKSPMWATVLGTCVVAPLGEEFIFRKLFIDRARRFGDAPAILLSGLVFGLFHANLYQFFYATMLGILLAYIYTRTGNFWLCASMHAAINLMAGVVIPALSELIPIDQTVELTSTQALVSLALAVWVYGTILSAIVLFIKRHPWRVLSPSPDRRSTRSAMRDAFGSPGMLAALILLSMIIVLNLVLPVLMA